MSPKTKQQNEIIRKQSIEAIKQAALKLFGKKGYGNTSISAIAKEAGVSKGLMYNYFESKQELLAEIIKDATSVSAELMKDITDEAISPKKRLKILIVGTFDWVMSHLPYYKLLASLAFQDSVTEEMGDAIKEGSNGNFKLAEQLFTELEYEHPMMATLEFLALLDGVFIHYMNIGEGYPIGEMQNFFLRKYDLVEVET